MLRVGQGGTGNQILESMNSTESIQMEASDLILELDKI
jgi:hypothetical protein